MYCNKLPLQETAYLMLNYFIARVKECSYGNENAWVDPFLDEMKYFTLEGV